MLSHHKESMENYLWHISRGEFSVETRPKVRQERFNKYARIPLARTLLAIYFIAKDDAFLTSGNAAVIVYSDGKQIYDSTTGDLTYSELKAKYGKSLL